MKRFQFPLDAVKRLRAGRYALVVHDASAHEALYVQKQGRKALAITAAAFTGERTVRIDLTRGTWRVYATPVPGGRGQDLVLLISTSLGEFQATVALARAAGVSGPRPVADPASSGGPCGPIPGRCARSPGRRAASSTRRARRAPRRTPTRGSAPASGASRDVSRCPPTSSPAPPGCSCSPSCSRPSGRRACPEVVVSRRLHGYGHPAHPVVGSQSSRGGERRRCTTRNCGARYSPSSH